MSAAGVRYASGEESMDGDMVAFTIVDGDITREFTFIVGAPGNDAWMIEKGIKIEQCNLLRRGQ